MKSNKLILSILSMAFLAAIAPLHADAVKPQIPADYPLKTCPVSGDELGGSMGKAVMVSDKGTDVYLCCKMCRKAFEKDPAKYTKMVKDAAAKNAK